MPDRRRSADRIGTNVALVLVHHVFPALPASNQTWIRWQKSRKSAIAENSHWLQQSLKPLLLLAAKNYRKKTFQCRGCLLPSLYM